MTSQQDVQDPSQDRSSADDAANANGTDETTGSAPAEDVTQLRQEMTELKDRYVRVFADMENMRRRQERERADLIKYSLETAFKDFLPVLDSLEKALPDDTSGRPNGTASDSSYLEGMLMVKRQLLDAFRKHGLEVISAAGAAFDPNIHQAIQRVESADVSTETVGNEYARGYQLNGRLLRPAMVSVLIPTDG